ncbi:hypothetical protein OFN32_37985, partial [Escherichia coli]|nr:hypothetical protein [Escherichia coli]
MDRNLSLPIIVETHAMADEIAAHPGARTVFSSLAGPFSTFSFIIESRPLLERSSETDVKTRPRR